MRGRDETQEIDELLSAARDAQTEFWNALADLEGALGCEVDGTQDLELVTVESLISA